MPLCSTTSRKKLNDVSRLKRIVAVNGSSLESMYPTCMLKGDDGVGAGVKWRVAKLRRATSPIPRRLFFAYIAILVQL